MRRSDALRLGNGHRWSRRSFLRGAAGAAMAAGVQCARPDRPNVVVVMVDQLRSSAVSAHGERNIQTPVVDLMLRQGADCEIAMASNPLCTPSRASFLTGRYPHSIGVIGNGIQLPLNYVTLAGALRQERYRCGYIGKWHLDGDAMPGFVPRERRHGFVDYWAAFNRGHAYRNSRYYIDSGELVRPEPYDAFEPEYQTDLAIEQLHAWRKRSFLLMISYGLPHPPGRVGDARWEDHIPSRYLDRVDPTQLSFAPNVPQWIIERNFGPTGLSEEDDGTRAYLRGYYAAILALEDSLSRLLAAVDELNADRPTLVVFTSDHGDNGGGRGEYHKGLPYDDASRVPLGFRWPGVIAADTRLSFPVSHVDVLPTVLGLVGAPPVAGGHGIDLSPWLLGYSPPAPSTAYSEGRMLGGDSWRMLRSEQWMYVDFIEQAHQELYDMQADPWQMENLAYDSAFEGVVGELAEQLKAWREATGEATG